MRELLSAPGQTEHPNRLPCRGCSVSSSHILGFPLCSGSLLQFPRRRANEDEVWLIFGTQWGPFPETEKSPDPRVLLRQADFHIHPRANPSRLQSLPEQDLVSVRCQLCLVGRLLSEQFSTLPLGLARALGSRGGAMAAVSAWQRGKAGPGKAALRKCCLGWQMNPWEVLGGCRLELEGTKEHFFSDGACG